MLINIINKIEDNWIKLIAYIYKYDFHPDSGRFYLYPSARVDGAKRIILETGVTLFRRGWIYIVPSEFKDPLIHIKFGTKIYDNFHITAANKITIGRSCLITRNVLITDSLHNYNDTTIPIKEQGITTRETFIDDGCWIGNNCVIVASTIGKNCVIGAGSILVNQHIPDYSVVSGNPAQIIRTIKPRTKKQKTDTQ